MPPKLRVAAATDRGGRAEQQDAVTVGAFKRLGDTRAGKRGAFAVLTLADGVGGRPGGQEASKRATEASFAALSQASPDRAPKDRLKDSVVGANESLSDAAASDKDLEGLGTTLIASYVEKGQLHWASIGDSALFLFRDGTLSRLNEDHSVEGARADFRLPEGASDAPPNALLSAVAGGEISRIELKGDGLPLKRGDVVVLASDGVFSVPAERLSGILAMLDRSGPEMIANGLISAVTDAEVTDQDNTAVAVLTVERRRIARPLGVLALGLGFIGAVIRALALFWTPAP